MTKRFRMYTKIRTDNMENKIAWAIFVKDYATEDVLRDLCNSLGIPIRETEIEHEASEMKRIDDMRGQ